MPCTWLPPTFWTPAAVWNRLRQLDCDLVQGYYVSPPRPGQLLTAWLDDLGSGRLPGAAAAA